MYSHGSGCTRADACQDRDRDETASGADNAAGEAGAEVREGAKDVGNAAEDADKAKVQTLTETVQRLARVTTFSN